MSAGRITATPQADARLLHLARGLILFTPVSLLGDGLGPLLRYPEVGAAVLYLPYAALTTALVLAPRRDWVWYILAGAVTHFIAHWPHWTLAWVLVATVANSARALAAAVMVRWIQDRTPRLDAIRALLLFVAAAALLAPALGATIGATNVVLRGEAVRYWGTWQAWFMSNALTGLTALPAFLYVAANLARGPRYRTSGRRVLEGFLLTATLGATCVVAFFVPSAFGWAVALPFYLPMPVLIWAALRFGSGGASLALTGVAIAAIWGADRGTAPFHVGSRDQDVLALQLFVLLTTFPVLCIAAIGGARQNAIQLYRALLASLDDHVAILDERGVVLEVNASWRQFVESAAGKRLPPMRVGDDFLQTCRIAAAAGDVSAARIGAGIAGVLAREQRRFDVECEVEHEGGRDVYALRIEALERSDGGAVVTRANVTARREAQIEIEQQRRELSHLARVSVLGELSGALAHELSQPLASIRSNADAALLLLQHQPPDLVDVGAMLRDVVRDDERAAQVIHRLSALLRRGETRLQPMDTREMVNEVLELAHGELIARRVAVTAVVEPNPPAVLGDRVQMQQVLLNLIFNACDAMNATVAPDRALLLKVETDARSQVHISLRDCGTGIPSALIGRLFEPFVTTKAEGLGLGLSISRTIVAAHGGRLWAENNADRGATFHCVLPAAPAVASPAPQVRSAAAGAAPTLPPPTPQR